MDVAFGTWSTIAVPEMVVGPLTEDEDGILLWVHAGTATVDAAGSVYELTAGAAIWVPAGIEHVTRTDAGAVVFPLRLLAVDRPPTVGEPRVVTIPAGWGDWLIHQWDDNSATSAAVPRAEALVALITNAPPTVGRPARSAEPLRLPQSREAAGVARTLLQSPGLPRTLEAFAVRERISAKTLQRQFVRETGMTFSAWRTRARVAIAARRLDDGRAIGETGREVGYVTPAGFTRAFRAHTGVSPRQYVMRDTTPPRAVEADEPVSAMASPFGAGDPQPPPSIPARTFWDKVNDHHELMWVYRGMSTLRIGKREWFLSEGDALWVPAGLTHRVDMPAGSLMLTVGVAHGRFPISVDDLIVFTFPAAAEAVLLHTMISEFTLLRPAVDPGRLVKTLFNEQFLFALPHADRPTGALGDIAVALRRDPADARSLGDWAAHLRMTPEELSRELLSQSGETFPQWRSRMRMDIARDMLRAGDAPGQIFRRLGYASPAAFSRAFAHAHGISARDYRRREQLANR